MPRNAPAHLSSTDLPRALDPGVQRRALAASVRMKLVERLAFAGLGGYLLMWFLRPIFEIAIAGIIYAARPDLLSYAVVGLAANMLLFNAIFYCGEILDRERVAGTLAGLFLVPTSRFGWLGGFQLVGLIETVPVIAAALLFGKLAYGVAFDPNYFTLTVTLVLFLPALWGLSMIFGAIGLLIKKANQLSNLLYPFTLLLGGVMYPVALLPDWLRIPARTLPFGYAFQAMADGLLRDARLAEVMSDLVPLAGFAVVLPVLGWWTMRWIERLVRQRGELDLY